MSGNGGPDKTEFANFSLGGPHVGRTELVGHLPAELQQTTSVQSWYRVHDFRNSKAQALTIAL